MWIDFTLLTKVFFFPNLWYEIFGNFFKKLTKLVKFTLHLIYLLVENVTKILKESFYLLEEK
jgi:hypothetical protein